MGPRRTSSRDPLPPPFPPRPMKREPWGWGTHNSLPSADRSLHPTTFPPFVTCCPFPHRSHGVPSNVWDAAPLLPPIPPPSPRKEMEGKGREVAIGQSAPAAADRETSPDVMPTPPAPPSARSTHIPICFLTVLMASLCQTGQRSVRAFWGVQKCLPDRIGWGVTVACDAAPRDG